MLRLRRLDRTLPLAKSAVGGTKGRRELVVGVKRIFVLSAVSRSMNSG